MCEDAAWPHDIDVSNRQNICLYLSRIRGKKEQCEGRGFFQLLGVCKRGAQGYRRTCRAVPLGFRPDALRTSTVAGIPQA